MAGKQRVENSERLVFNDEFLGKERKISYKCTTCT